MNSLDVSKQIFGKDNNHLCLMRDSAANLGRNLDPNYLDKTNNIERS